ncbi:MULTISPECIES: hypothetical protein [unclassified Streptomyces]|uniref:hypothetical protein n=1 Tax=unclassified Streptomyces TaxID=2593676 RepID=UPI00368DCB25
MGELLASSEGAGAVHGDQVAEPARPAARVLEIVLAYICHLAIVGGEADPLQGGVGEAEGDLCDGPVLAEHVDEGLVPRQVDSDPRVPDFFL